MNKLRGLAAATGAEFEIYSRSVESKKIDIENSQLKDAQSAMSDGVSLRLLKDGMCGFSFTGDLKDPEALVNNALASLKSGVGEEFLFPGNKIFPRLKTFSEQAASVTSENLLEEAFRIAGGLRNRSLAQINASVKLSVIETRIFNSSGTDISWKESFVDKTGAIVSPGGAKYVAGESSFGLTRMSESLLEAVAGWSEADKTEIRPVPGKRNVLFMPSAMDALLSRIQSGCSGQSLHQNTTPLAGRIGEEVFSEKLTLRNNLLDDSFPGGRFADDEGVPCSDFVLFEKGVFRGFYFDLNYAAKAGSVSTGHGFRRSAWGADPVTMKPLPYLTRLCFDNGGTSFEDLVKDMNSGIIVFRALGVHTGNIPNGDFSIGLSTGLCVENGRIVGKARDTMVSGNIYDVLKRVAAVGSERDPYYANNPPVLVEGVDVSS